MAFMLVSLESAKSFIRVTSTDDDADIEFMISAASRMVVKYLKDRAGEVIGIDSPPNSPPDDLSGVHEDVAWSVKYLVAVMFENRGRDADKNFDEAVLPMPVRAALGFHRDPTLA